MENKNKQKKENRSSEAVSKIKTERVVVKDYTNGGLAVQAVIRTKTYQDGTRRMYLSY